MYEIWFPRNHIMRLKVTGFFKIFESYILQDVTFYKSYIWKMENLKK